MDLEVKLRNTREKLARIKENREIELRKHKQELAQREQQGERAETLERFRNWVTNYEASSAQQISAMEAEIADLEAQVNTEEYQVRKQARDNLDGLKETARSTWLTAGGPEEDFEGAWLRLKQAYLQQQVLKVISVSMETAA